MRRPASKCRRNWSSVVSWSTLPPCEDRVINKDGRYKGLLTASLSGTLTRRFQFAQQILESDDTFYNVIFSDECSVSLQQYQRTCYRKIDELTKRKPKRKHPLKVHVWAGISRHGAREICIFDNIMDAELYCSILETTLVPFINQTLPDHKFMQDNDPKHTSR